MFLTLDNELIYKRQNVKGNEEENIARNTANEKTFHELGNYINTDELITTLKQGDYFLKYGRSGNPHKTFVQLSADESRLLWKPTTCTCFNRKRYIETDTVIIL
jgi:hypothetical protein